MAFSNDVLQALSFFAVSIGILGVFFRLIKLGGYFRR